MELSSSLASCWLSPATRNTHPEWHKVVYSETLTFHIQSDFEGEYALMSLLSGRGDPLASWRGIHLEVRPKPSSAMHSLQPGARS